MGLRFHDSGWANPEACLPAMIKEFTDIVDSYKWSYSIVENEFWVNSLARTGNNQNIYRTCFTTRGCETH